MIVTGSPVAEVALGVHIIEDLFFLIPFSIGIMALIFWLRFRSLYAVMLPLTEVLACLLFIFGLMGWIGIPVYLTITVMPVILTAIGISDEVHVLNCYQRLLGSGSKEETIEKTVQVMSPRIILTSVTTSLGFLAFLLSPSRSGEVFWLVYCAWHPVLHALDALCYSGFIEIIAGEWF